MDRVDEDTPPQVVHASAADLCRHVTFSKPQITIEDVHHMAEGETLVSPTRTKMSTVTSAVLLPIPLQWAPLFLTEEEPINAKDAFVGLSKLASSIHRGAHDSLRNRNDFRLGAHHPPNPQSSQTGHRRRTHHAAPQWGLDNLAQRAPPRCVSITTYYKHRVRRPHQCCGRRRGRPPF
jgi:hypothetical protein